MSEAFSVVIAAGALTFDSPFLVVEEVVSALVVLSFDALVVEALPVVLFEALPPLAV